MSSPHILSSDVSVQWVRKSTPDNSMGSQMPLPWSMGRNLQVWFRWLCEVVDVVITGTSLFIYLEKRIEPLLLGGGCLGQLSMKIELDFLCLFHFFNLFFLCVHVP